MDKNVNSDCIDSCGHDAASYLQISARVPSIHCSKLILRHILNKELLLMIVRF